MVEWKGGVLLMGGNSSMESTGGRKGRDRGRRRDAGVTVVVKVC